MPIGVPKVTFRSPGEEDAVCRNLQEKELSPYSSAVPRRDMSVKEVQESIFFLYGLKTNNLFWLFDPIL